MSEIEHKTGKLKPCEMRGTVEETCKAILSEMGIDDHKFCDSYRKKLEDEGYRKYFITDTAVYEVGGRDKDPYGDIYNATKNEDGSIDFEVRYYRGGWSFNEALEEAIKVI